MFIVSVMLKYGFGSTRSIWSIVNFHVKNNDLQITPHRRNTGGIFLDQNLFASQNYFFLFFIFYFIFYFFKFFLFSTNYLFYKLCFYSSIILLLQCFIRTGLIFFAPRFEVWSFWQKSLKPFWDTVNVFQGVNHQSPKLSYAFLQLQFNNYYYVNY